MNNNFRVIRSLVLTCVFIAVLFPVQSKAQTATLRVQVISNKDGAPLIGANVRLLSYDNKKLKQGGTTGKHGFIGFSGIAAKKYRLVISFVGFKTSKKIIELKEGEIKNIIIRLRVSTSNLPELTVTGETNVTTGNVGVQQISPADIERVPSPSVGGDLVSYLRTLPGIIQTSGRGGNLYIQGGIPSQNKVLVDNMPVIKPFHILNLFSAFPAQTVQNVDVYTAGFGAKYRDVNSAVIDVTLRPGNYNKWEESISASPYLASLELEGPINKGTTSLLLLGRKSLIGQTSSAIYGDKKHIKFSDITARLSSHGQNVTCNATVLYTYDRGRINPAREIGLSWKNVVIGGNCLVFSPNLKNPLNITAGYSYFRNQTASHTAKTRYSSISNFFLKFNSKANAGNIAIHYGANFSGRQYSFSLHQRFTNSYAFGSSDQGILSAYLAMVYSNSFLSIRPSIGVLYTFHQTPAFEPRLRLAFHPGGNKNIEISMAGGKYYQTNFAISDVRNAGSVFQFWQPIGKNEHSLPRAIHALIGYKQRIDNFVINLDGYIKNYKHILVPKWTPVARFNTTTAPANGFAHGFDLQVKFDKQPFFFSLKYGYADVVFKAASKNLGAWIKAPVFRYHPAFDQRHKVNVLASYKTRAITANISWSFGSGQPYTKVYGFDLVPDILKRFYPLVILTSPGTARALYSRPYGQRLPTYHQLDISVEHTFKFSKSFSLKTKAGAINLFDRKNILYFDSNSLQRVNQPGILPYIAIQTTF